MGQPPWHLWPQAADKLLTSQCTALCVLPAWDKEWARRIVHTATKRLYLEAGSRLFERHGRKLAGTHWGTWVVRIEGKVRPAMDNTRAYATVLVPRWSNKACRAKEAQVEEPEEPASHRQAGSQEVVGRPRFSECWTCSQGQGQWGRFSRRKAMR